MDTKAIASEIVSIKNRLGEIEDLDEHDDNVEEERRELVDRLRHLQNMLSGQAPTRGRQEPDSVQYVPPA